MNTVIDSLYKSLSSSNKVVYFNPSKTELMCRCPYCGDSVKSNLSAHLYIKTEPPFAFFCQRCESSGLLNKDLMHDISVDDYDLEMLIRKEITDFKRNNLTTKFSFQKPTVLKIPKIQDDFSWRKSYIEERIGCELTKNDIRDFRLIPNFEDLLVLNKLDYMLNNKKFLDDCLLCDAKGIGWLSRDNSHAVFRLVDHHMRYKVIKLSDSLTCSKVYSIRNDIDLTSLNLEVIMTEGTFDILSVFKNLYKGEHSKNRIFCASSGKGFNYFPIYLQREYGFLNISLHIYSDNDVDLDRYNEMLRKNRFDSIDISYNIHQGEKDFGVPLNLIKVVKHHVKRSS